MTTRKDTYGFKTHDELRFVEATRVRGDVMGEEVKMVVKFHNKTNDPHLASADEHEPIFTVLGRDASAGQTILAWMGFNHHLLKSNPQKMRDALDAAIAAANAAKKSAD